MLVAFVYAVAAKQGAHHLRFYSHMMQELFVPTIAAVVALVIGVSALGDEREDGTIYYLVATPQSRLGLIVTKVAAAWTATLLLLVPSVVVSALLILKGGVDASSILWPVAGVALATLAYCGVAGWLSLRTRRPIVIGVLYILLWEGSIATFAASASKLSIAAYGRALVAERLPEAAAPVVGPSAGGRRPGGRGGRHLLAGCAGARAGRALTGQPAFSVARVPSDVAVAQ